MSTQSEGNRRQGSNWAPIWKFCILDMKIRHIKSRPMSFLNVSVNKFPAIYEYPPHVAALAPGSMSSTSSWLQIFRNTHTHAYTHTSAVWLSCFPIAIRCFSPGRYVSLAFNASVNVFYALVCVYVCVCLCVCGKFVYIYQLTFISSNITSHNPTIH